MSIHRKLNTFMLLFSKRLIVSLWRGRFFCYIFLLFSWLSSLIENADAVRALLSFGKILQSSLAFVERRRRSDPTVMYFFLSHKEMIEGNVFMWSKYECYSLVTENDTGHTQTFSLGLVFSSLDCFGLKKVQIINNI